MKKEYSARTIRDIQDVRGFARQLVRESCNFHPDNDFREYVTLGTNNKRFYTSREAEKRNRAMEKCCKVCNKHGRDIYLVMGNVLTSHLKKMGFKL